MASRRADQQRSILAQKRQSINVSRNVREFSKFWGGGGGGVLFSQLSHSKKDANRRRSISHCPQPSNRSPLRQASEGRYELARKSDGDLKLSVQAPMRKGSHGPSLGGLRSSFEQMDLNNSPPPQRMQHPFMTRSLHCDNDYRAILPNYTGTPVLAPILPPEPTPNLHPALRPPVVNRKYSAPHQSC